MPPSGKLGLRWDENNRNSWVEISYSVTARQGTLNTADKSDTQRIPPGGTPGYKITTLRGGGKLFANTNLSVAVENLTDENYRVHGSGQNEVGRNFVATVDSFF